LFLRPDKSAQQNKPLLAIMRKLSSFSFITLNGFMHDGQGDISWHRHGEEENRYAAEGSKSGSTLLFGRVTYEMMASYWPTPMAMENSTDVAEGMNNAEKIVFSKTLQAVHWNNTRIIGNNIVEAVKQLKTRPGSDLNLLGSGSILTLLADHGLIDEFQIMLDPVVIGSGVPIFSNISHKPDLELIHSQTFKSGVILLKYKPR